MGRARGWSDTEANGSKRLIQDTGSGCIVTKSVRMAGYTQVARLDNTEVTVVRGNSSTPDLFALASCPTKN